MQAVYSQNKAMFFKIRNRAFNSRTRPVWFLNIRAKALLYSLIVTETLYQSENQKPDTP